MEPFSLSEAQVLQNLFTRISGQQFDEIKTELKLIREDLDKILKTSSRDELLSMQEVCKLLKLSRPSVTKLIREKKKLKAVQLLDQDFRFLRSDVDKLIKSSYKELN